MADAGKDQYEYFDYDGQPCRKRDSHPPEILTPKGRWVFPSNDQFDTKAVAITEEAFVALAKDWLEAPAPKADGGKGVR